MATDPINTKTKLLKAIAAIISVWLFIPAIPTHGAEAKEQSRRTPMAIETLGIPTSMQSDARAAQRQGKCIFLWREHGESVTASDTPFGQLITLEVSYARLYAEDNASFGLYFLTGATTKNSTAGITYVSETDGPTKIERTGQTTVAFISPKDKLSGEGFAFVFAVEPSKDKKSERLRELSEAISNEIKLMIKFQDGKKPQK